VPLDATNADDYYNAKFIVCDYGSPCLSLAQSFQSFVNYNNNNEKLVLHYKMQMQTHQRTPLSNHETRNETNVSSAYS